jgi:hypothetical protein
MVSRAKAQNGLARTRLRCKRFRHRLQDPIPALAFAIAKGAGLAWRDNLCDPGSLGPGLSGGLEQGGNNAKGAIDHGTDYRG